MIYVHDDMRKTLLGQLCLRGGGGLGGARGEGLADRRDTSDKAVRCVGADEASGIGGGRWFFN